MGVSAIIGAASLAISAVTTVASMNQAAQQAEMQQEAAEQREEFQLEESARQRDEIRRQETEQVSDIVRKTNADLATTQVLAGARGSSQSTIEHMMSDIAFVEGVDISRTQKNAQAKVDRTLANDRAARYETNYAIAQSQANKQASQVNAGLQFANSAVQIGSTAYNNHLKSQAVN